MPQVWLNEEELGEFLGCDPISARHRAIQSNWHRRISADSVMRYHLPPHAALHYVLGARTLRQDLDATERLAAA